MSDIPRLTAFVLQFYMNNIKILLTFFVIFSSFFIFGCSQKVTKLKTVDIADIQKDMQTQLSVTSKQKKKLNPFWWREFHDKQLSSIISKALKTAPSLKSIEQRYIKANMRVKKANSTKLPTLGLSGGAYEVKFNKSVVPEPLAGETQSFFTAGVATRYKFDFWDERKSRILATKNRAYAQKIYIDEQKLALSTAIARFYISWSFEEQQIDLLQEVLSNYKEQKNIETQKFVTGLSDSIALNHQNENISNTEYKILQLRESIEGQKEAICILAGLYPSAAKSFTKPTIHTSLYPQIDKGVYLNSLSNRPDIEMQKFIIKSNSYYIAHAQSRFYPNINLSGVLNLFSLDLSGMKDSDSFGAIAGISLDLPIFDWGRREANLEEKLANYNSSIYEYNHLVTQAANETVGTLMKIRYVQKQVKAYEHLQDQRVKNSNIIHTRYTIGVINKLPYLQSELGVLQSRFVLLGLSQNSNHLYIELIKALGGGFIADDKHS
ncbi:MAG: efflux transporter outer membrane subunit [Sulfurimonas sp.]|nr:efflux transporter outer membrane subunit [Sulfurimonas sp.]